MIYLSKNIKEISSVEILFISEILNKGGVIVTPTDTIYGLSCLATDKKAINLIKSLKKRDANKPFLILVSSWRMAKKYCFISKKQSLLIKKYSELKRPSSFILDHQNLLAPNLVNSNMGLGVRLPKSDFLLKIIRKTKCPLVTTSLNLSGENFAEEVDNLEEKNIDKNKIDLVIDIGKIRGKASKILDIRNNELKIIRK